MVKNSIEIPKTNKEIAKNVIIYVFFLKIVDFIGKIKFLGEKNTIIDP